MKKVCMLGSGAWGTAVSTVLADNGCEVAIWCHDPTVAKNIERDHCNTLYLPDVMLSKHVKAYTDIGQAMEGVEWVFEATPVKFLRSVLLQAKPYFFPEQKWVVLSKGIENETLLLPSQMIDDVLEAEVKKVAVSGPSFAKDVSLKKLTAVDIASKDEQIAAELQKLLTNYYFRCFCSSDIRGIQLGGSLKNVLALAFGMLEGAGYGANTKFFMLTIGLHEMVRFARFVKIKEETIYSLSGLGDLMLTCAGGLSKNVMVGRLLGQGKSLDEIVKATGAIAEGVNTIKSIYEIIQHFRLAHPTFSYAHHAFWGDRINLDMKHGVELPLFESIHEVIFGDKGVNDLINSFSGMQLEKMC